MSTRRVRTHKDVEYCTDLANGEQFCSRRFDEAAGRALAVAASRGSARLDVLVHSKAGARFHGGDDAVEQYAEDPEASVFERLEIRVNPVGRVA